MSPQGKTFTQGMAEELAQEEELIFLCGHYEGIDERVLDEIVTDYPENSRIQQTHHYEAHPAPFWTQHLP